MFRGLTGRIIAAGGILLVLIGGSFAVLFVAIGELRSADAQVSRSATELRAANEIERLLVDMETGLRGFVITGEERFLEPWDSSRHAIPTDVDALVERTDNSTQMTRARAIAAAGTAYIEDYGVPLIESVRNGDPSASSVATTDLGRRRVDDLRSLLTDFIGKVVDSHRSYLGVTVADVTTAAGVLVRAVSRGGPAADARIEVGDLIVSIDGHATPSSVALADILANLTPGQRVPVAVLRPNGTRATVDVTLGELPG